MKKTYLLNELEIPLSIIERDGPFSEFKKDASFVTVELTNSKKISGVLILYPNYVIAIEGENNLSFSPNDVSKVIQTEKDKTKKSSSDWSFFYNSSDFSRL